MPNPANRNPFGIPEDDPNFWEKLVEKLGIKTSNSFQTMEAFLWLDQWQKTNPPPEAIKPHAVV